MKSSTRSLLFTSMRTYANNLNEVLPARTFVFAGLKSFADVVQDPATAGFGKMPKAIRRVLNPRDCEELRGMAAPPITTYKRQFGKGKTVEYLSMMKDSIVVLLAFKC